MTDPVTQTEAEAKAARSRLEQTALRVRDRLAPSELLADGAQVVRLQALASLDNAKQAARKNPATIVAGAIVAGATIALAVKLAPKAAKSAAAATTPKRKLTLGQVANGVILVAKIISTVRRNMPRR